MFCFCAVVIAQNNDEGSRSDGTGNIIDYIANAMNFQNVNPQEKVYLHTDNTGYFKGETIFFKAYVVRNNIKGEGISDYLPTDKSEILYVELLNSYGETVAKRKLKIVDGEAYGDIKLDNCIQNSGFYELRAYTRYMMNFGGETAFSRLYPIFRAPKRPGDYAEPVIDRFGWHNRLPSRDSVTVGYNRTTVNIYPEGGDLIAGIPSRVAYIVTDGEGEVSRGVLENIDGNTERTVELLNRKGKRIKATLPAAKAGGCAMHVEAVDGDSIMMTLRCSQDIHGQTLAYILMHEGSIVECDTFTCGTPYIRSFSRTALPAGVNQLTVIDSYGRIKSERLFFICQPPSATDTVRITTDAESLSPCCKVSMQLHGEPNARYSFSAMDAGTLANGDIGCMRSYMLLGSDLRGYIPNPDYYFESDDTEHRSAADLLMLTQGWRRYDFEYMDGAVPKSHTEPLEKEMCIYGKVLDSKHLRPMPGVDLKAFLYNGGSSMSGEAVTGKYGDYLFNINDLQDDWNLQMVATKNGKPVKCIITIDRRFSPPARIFCAEEADVKPMPYPNMSFSMDSTEVPTMVRRDGEYHISTVTVRGRYFTDDSRMRWHDESIGRGRSSLFYNCEEICDELYDRGKGIPDVYQWLDEKNPFFTYSVPDQSIFNRMFNNDLIYVYLGGERIDTRDKYGNPLVEDEGIYEYDFLTTRTSRSLNMYSDGYTYKTRPIIWCLNNAYAGATGVTNLMLDKDHERTNVIEGGIQKLKLHLIQLSMENSSALSKFDNCQVEIPTIESLPIRLDEVKSIYISEEPGVFNDMLICDDLETAEAVSIFLYTYPRYSTASRKGRRYTHFQGFNIPTKFEMDDYSLMPPVADDFRRTLYWAPSVVADENGDATVEFYNNSTCKDMYISVEGITQDGLFVNN